jgi:hypothetical protein
MEDRCWKKFAKGLIATTNFLEVLVNDEKTILLELNRICGEEKHVFTNTIEVQKEGLAEDEHMEVNMGIKVLVKSKILSQFIKGKVSLTPMETIFIIPGELEYLKGLVKLARKRKNVENYNHQIATIHQTPAIRKVNVNKAHRSKTLHLGVEINQALIEGLVDIRVSMSIMVASVVREFSIMHLMIGHETYKTPSRMVTQALGKITNLLVRVGGITC